MRRTIIFEAFKIGIRLSLANDVSAGILLLTGQFGRLDKQLQGTRAHLSAIELQMARLKTMGTVGGALAGAGALGLAALKGPIDAAKDYENAFTRFKTLNLGAEVNKQADQFAKGTKAFGVSSKDLMETLRESVGIFGGMPNALKIAPLIAELNAANSSLFGGKVGKLDEHGIRALMRFNDMRGLTDSPEDFRKGLSLAQRMVTGSGGMIKFQDLEQLAKKGGTAFKSMSEDGIFLMSIMLQEMGGAASGTALMSAYQNLVAGRTTKKTMAALEASGLATLGQVGTGTVGGKKSTGTQIVSMVDPKMLRENFPLWLMTYAEPAARRSGAKDDAEVAQFINSILSNRTGSNMGTIFTTQQLQALRDAKLAKGAMGPEDTIAAWKQTTAGKLADLQAKYNTLQSELGDKLLPAVNAGLKLLTDTLGRLITLGRSFPTLTTALVGTFAVLSGLAAAGGAIMVAKAAFGALAIALGSGGAAAGGAGLVGALGMAGTAVVAFAGALAGLAAGFAVGSALNKGIDALLSKIRGQETSLGASIYDWTHAETKVKRDGPGFGSTGGGAAFGSPYVRGQRGASKQALENTIVMPDGRVLAKVVTEAQAKELSRPATGPRSFDGRMQPQGSW